MGPSTHQATTMMSFRFATWTISWILHGVAFASLTVPAVQAQLNPPTILRGTAPTGDVRSMSNNQNCLASMADGSVVTVVYRRTSATAGGHLRLAITADEGKTWSYYPLPHNAGHDVHDPESGVLCAGTDCDRVHVAWADRSVGGVEFSAWYSEFDTTTRRWVGTPTLLGAAVPASRQSVRTRDITMTPLGTLAVALGVGPNGGLGMGPHDCGLRIKKRGQSFGPLQPMRNGGMGWSREATIVAGEEIIHCAFKTLEGAGGICYRSFDTESDTWQQSAQVPVGPNNNGIAGLNGINAGNKSMIARTTEGGLYILYVSGNGGGLASNHKMRMAYAAPGTGSTNADWADLEVLPHTTLRGANPRNVLASHPSYPLLQGGDTSYTNYTLAPGFQGSLIVIYSKPWEDFQNKYIQIYQFGINVPVPTKEINFWPDVEPFVFERMCGMRSTFSVGHAAWVVYGKNDKPTPGQAPNGLIRLWATTTSTGRTIAFGTGCKGNLPDVPRMRADDQYAALANPYHVDCSRFPPNANFYLILGTKCETVDMTAMGAPGCEINIDFPAFVPLQVDAAGERRLSWTVPQVFNLVGTYFYTQSYVISPPANAALAVTSNALRISISQ